MHLSTALALLGCSSGADPATDPTAVFSGTSLETPIAWTFEPPPPAPDNVDLPALEAALALAIEELLRFDASPVIDRYVSRYDTSATAACPAATLDPYGNLYWANGCTSADGTGFGGYLSHYRYQDVIDGDMVVNGEALSGVITVIDPAGNALDLEGDAQWLQAVSLDGFVEIVSSAISGGFAWDGPGTDWLATDGPQAVTVGLTQFRVPSVSGRGFAATGAVNVTVDGALHSVRFIDNFVADEVVGSRCGLEPGGLIEVRDAWGRWISVTFHGPILEAYEGDAAQCDGCGDAEADGVALGTVCADFSPWLAWEAP